MDSDDGFSDWSYSSYESDEWSEIDAIMKLARAFLMLEHETDLFELALLQLEHDIDMFVLLSV